LLYPHVALSSGGALKPQARSRLCVCSRAAVCMMAKDAKKGKGKEADTKDKKKDKPAPGTSPLCSSGSHSR
jgi:hypothetical protein